MDFWAGIIEFGSASARLAARRPKYSKIVIFRFPVRRLVGGGGLILRLEHKITGLLRFGSPMHESPLTCRADRVKRDAVRGDRGGFTNWECSGDSFSSL